MNHKYLSKISTYWPVILVALFAFLSQVTADFIPIAYQRDALLQGEWWRLITGGWLHHNFSHLAMNVVAWAFIWQLMPQRLAGVGGVLLLGLEVTLVDVTLLLLSPETEYYWGLSGALHGVFAVSAIILIKEHDKQGWWWLLGLLIKLGWDLLRTDVVTSELIGTRVHVESHIMGAVTGLVVGLILVQSRIMQKPT
jgi:rhomboid family GlyGly-CTERM serine protease